MLCYTIQYNTIQYNTIQYHTIQYNAMLYNTIQYNTIQYNTIQYNTIQYNTIQNIYKCVCVCRGASEGEVDDALDCLTAQLGGTTNKEELLKHSAMEVLAERCVKQLTGKPL